jgi:hypothetical protein
LRLIDLGDLGTGQSLPGREELEREGEVKDESVGEYI